MEIFENCFEESCFEENVFKFSIKLSRLWNGCNFQNNSYFEKSFWEDPCITVYLKYWIEKIAPQLKFKRLLFLAVSFDLFHFCGK